MTEKKYTEDVYSFDSNSQLILDLQDYMEMEDQILQAMRASKRNLWINEQALEQTRQQIKKLQEKKK